MTHDFHVVIYNTEKTEAEAAGAIMKAFLDGKCTVLIGPGDTLEAEDKDIKTSLS